MYIDLYKLYGIITLTWMSWSCKRILLLSFDLKCKAHSIRVDYHIITFTIMILWVTVTKHPRIPFKKRDILCQTCSWDSCVSNDEIDFQVVDLMIKVANTDDSTASLIVENICLHFNFSLFCCSNVDIKLVFL